jgi:regulator of sigma E protease
MATLKFAFIIFEVLLLFNLLIGVHELGHFLAAKWRGLKIERFAIWFGKPIWKKKIGGVEYALGWIPAGGYVALPQMATMEMIEGKRETSDKSSSDASAIRQGDLTSIDTLPNISALDKIIVAFAGPLFSFLLACFFACVVYWVGKPVDAAPGSTEVGWVGENGPAWKAGIRPGDKIIEVDNRPVSQFGLSQDSIQWRIITSEKSNIEIKYVRDGKEFTTYATPIHRPTKWYERKSFRQILIAPEQKSIVGAVVSNSPAAEAKLQPGDEVIALNGQKIYSVQTLFDVEASMTNGIKPVTMTIRRGNQEFDRTITAEKPIKPAAADPSFGIAWMAETNEVLTHPSPAEQIGNSASLIFATLGAVLSPKSEVGFQQLGGAVMIVRAYSSFIDSENGWRRVLWFSVVLNVNLALLNMLPFPVLDGGHILLALLEVIRRRAVNAKILQYLQTGCAMLLIAFMLFIAFFDIGDWVRSSRSERRDSQPIVFAPKAK